MTPHPSQRGYFAHYLYEAMKTDPDIWLIVIDLGYKMFDAHFEDFPERTINSGASEQAAMGIAVGLALEGKKVFIYSITTFLLYRPFETLRNYINHERIPVRLVGAGRDKDYQHDGFSHHSEDADQVLKLFPNISRLNPQQKEDIPGMVRMMVKENRPWFISLRR
jgi:transketolase